MNVRIHCISEREDQSIVTFRHAGEFFVSALDAGALIPADGHPDQKLTPESLVHVIGHKILSENEVASSERSNVTLNFKLSQIMMLSQAKADVSKNVLYHGSPVEQTATASPDSLQQRLDNRILDIRVPANAAIFKLLSGIQALAVEHLTRLDFYRIATPKIIGFEFPGDEHEQFKLDYFGQRAWLAQTGDVHLSMSIAADLERVYDLHTVFRQEEAVDSRHLTEVSNRFHDSTH
jgi:aspartyl-tRNA synthetase